MKLAELDQLYRNLFKDYLENQEGIKWDSYIKQEKKIVESYLIDLLNKGDNLKSRQTDTPIIETHRELVNEIWDWESNSQLEIFPDRYSSGSQQSAIFICPNNNTHPPYIKKIYQLFHETQGCPYCAGNYKRCITNSFGYLKKDFTQYWDIKQNGELTPFHVGIGAEEEVSFICAGCKKESKICKVQNYKVLRYCDSCKPHFKTKRKNRNPILNDEMESFYNSVWDEFSAGVPHNWEEIFEKEKEITEREFMKKIELKKRNNKKVEPLDLNSDLIQKEWNIELNLKLGIEPEKFSKGSSQIAVFNCIEEELHPFYDTEISNKTLNENKCPYCNLQRICIHNSFGYSYPEVAISWSDEKNGEVNPFKISHGVNKKYFFTCPVCENEEWYTTPINRVKRYACPTCMKGKNVSFPQHAIYYYFKKLVSKKTELCFDLNREIPKAHVLEIDVFLPYFKFGIEYHGEYYHKDKEESDLVKKHKITKRGIDLIIIRESDRLEFKETETQYIHYTKSGFGTIEYFNSLKECILKSFDYLCSNFPELLSVKNRFDEIDIKKDAFEIQKHLFYPKENHFFVTHPYLEEHWADEKNKKEGFRPEFFTAGSNTKVFWKCLTCNKESYERPIKTMCNSQQIIGCKSCMSSYMSKIKTDYFKNKPKYEVVSDSIAETHPDILHIWMYDKNGEMRPEYLKANSSEEIIVMWNGEERTTTVRNIIDSLERKEKRDKETKKKEKEIIDGFLKGHTKQKIKDDCKVSDKRINNVYEKYIESGIYQIQDQPFDFDSEMELQFKKLRDYGQSFLEIKQKMGFSHSEFQQYKEKLLKENRISKVQKISPEVIQNLLNEDYSIEEISEILNRSIKTIYHYIYLHKLSLPEKPIEHIFMTHHNLSEFYDYEKNAEMGIDYNNLTKSSEESVYWICKTHGSYKQRVDTKARSEHYWLCSECNQERFVDYVKQMREEEKYEVKENSLYDINPKVLNQIWMKDRNERSPKQYSANTPRETVWVKIDGKPKEMRIDHLNTYLNQYDEKCKKNKKLENEEKELKKKISKLLSGNTPYKKIMEELKIGQKRFYRLKDELE
ncbi:hypothetical protein LCL89_14150 [Halobacillus yeomjeoni]|uniref:zinc-ribbon domain-containing protein n=1 Tax=Halobacillus yeomjeoni TaxID=311194 RepID=UPI001CD234DA|nr:zinc-ribbon domain-containing protein [Halobacillus yeomjeoni]MCA0985170.1 hypothetical protein [Halobacillus yeomjeoni]